MQIVEKRLDELQPYKNNPRKNDNAVPYVAESIRQYGFKVPIVIDKDGVIVAGHTRYLAAMELSLDTVPCIVADDLTDEQIRGFRLVDNKTSEFAGWDWQMLEEELARVDFGEFDFGFPKVDFSDADIDSLFIDAPKKEQSEGTEHIITCPHCGELINIDDHFKVIQ